MDPNQPSPEPSGIAPMPNNEQPITPQPIIIQPTSSTNGTEPVVPVGLQQPVQNVSPSPAFEQPVDLQPELPPPPEPVSPNQLYTQSMPPQQLGETNPFPPQDQPPPPNYPVIGVTDTAAAMPSKPKRKRMVLGAGLIVLFLLVSSGVVFGYYLPNQPSNVYKTGLNRSAKALNQLVSAATGKSKLDAFKKSDVTLSVDATYQGISYSGTFNAIFDTSKANGGITFASKETGKPNQTFNAKFLGELPAGSQYPNIYLQLNGLKSLGIDALVPGASAYDGKWIAILSDYLKSLGTAPTTQQINKKQLTSDDIAELARAATSVTSQYVFSTDSSKAIFEKKNFVGKEKSDGLNTYHYQVSLNKDHASAYCKALVDSVYSTNAYKKLPWVDEKNVDKDKESSKKQCDTSSKSIDANMQYGLWIETKYKLIYKIRVPDSATKDTYTDIGQLYNGGDSVSLFAVYHNGKDKTDGKLTLDTNFQTSSTKGTVTVTGTDPSNKYDIKVILDAKPYNGEIKVDKPAGAIPIQEVLTRLGI